MRIRCHLFGCCEGPEGAFCFRCGADGYDAAFVPYDRGWVSPIRDWLRRQRALAWPRCRECKRRLWPWSKRFHDDFCSEECFSVWIPF